MRRIILAVLVLIAWTLHVENSQAQTPADEKQDIEMAENAILTRLAQLSASAQFCSEQPAACLSADRVELGTALIAARNSPQSLQACVRLHRFALDGSYGETFDELLCTKARLIGKYVEELHPVELHDECVKELATAVRDNPQTLENSKAERVCSSVDHIRLHIKNTLLMVKHPTNDCEP